MSHTNAVNREQETRLVQTTIVNYTQGGEAYTITEFNVDAIIGVLLGQISPTQNSLGVPLFPILVGGSVKLFQFVSGAPVEIPTTAALNAVLTVLIWYN